MGLRDKANNAKIIEDDNIYLSEPQKGLELSSKLISLGEMPFRVMIDEINTILKEFLEISSKDANQMAAITYNQLLEIKDDIINISNFPQLENHYTVAVGGGFSSGKSTFFNKVLGLKDVLPTDTNPTTSIPAYITKNKSDNFLALNNFGNIITLDKEAIDAISHKFNKKYSVSFSHIIKLLLIEQENLTYDKIVFLDTPGYSKSDSMNKENNIDENIAKEHLRNADFLIWLVDCQTPITDTDINFIKNLEKKHPILVVINKADKKIQSDIDLLVEKTKQNLIEKNIKFFDVVAYSSSKDIEYSLKQDVIKTYLSTINANETGTKILKNLNNIFKTYINYYDSELTENRTIRKTLNEIIMYDAVNENYIDYIKNFSSKIVKQNNDIEKHKKDIAKLQAQYEEIITIILKEVGISIIDKENKYIFEESFYTQNIKNKIKNQSHEFEGMIQIKDDKELLKYKNLNNLDGKVYKITSIGVFIKISDIKEADLLISKSKIIKEANVSNVDEVFKIDDSVSIQIIDNNKCVIKKIDEPKDIK